jgi:hypothetical protein
MHELAAGQILELIGGRRPPQNLVPVRLTTEASDDVAMPTGLVGRELEPGSELRRSLPNQFLCELDRELEMLQLLRVPEREHEEGLFPGRLESGVVADLETLEGERASLRIVREGAAASAMDGPGELVQYDDEGETGPSRMGPFIELASLGALQKGGKAPDDLLVCSASKPPFGSSDESSRVSRESVGEPEREYLLG